MKVRQCQLRRQSGERTQFLYSWIPISVAIVGREVQDKSGERWTVSEAYIWERENAPRPAKDIREHRRATGDSD